LDLLPGVTELTELASCDEAVLFDGGLVEIVHRRKVPVARPRWNTPVLYPQTSRLRSVLALKSAFSGG
jgi:hypothetical protein